MKIFFIITFLLVAISGSAISQTILLHTNDGTIHQFNLAEIDSITFSESTLILTENLLVENNEIAGWSHTDSRWVANNFEELTVQINGMAEIYKKHGFVDAAHQTYIGTIENTERQLSLTIFNQGNESNALATYEDPDIGVSDAVDWNEGAGQAAHYIRYSGLSQAMTFYRGQYFVYLVINCDTDESLNVLKEFALTVDAKIQ